MIQEYLQAKNNILKYLRFTCRNYLYDFGYKVSIKNNFESSEQIIIQELINNCLTEIQELNLEKIYQIQKEISNLETELAKIYQTKEIKQLYKLLEECDIKEPKLTVSAIKPVSIN